MVKTLSVLFEDNHLLVLNKPAGLPTMGVREDQESLWTLAKKYIKAKYHKPGNVYLGIVSRLDLPVSGVVVLARTSKAAARLNDQFRNHSVDKTYWVVVEGRPPNLAGTLVDWIHKDERSRKMEVTESPTSRSKKAELVYSCRRKVELGTLIEVQLISGRKHQIRSQFASLGLPVVGDRRYGSQRTFPRGIALHAKRLQFIHPVRQTPIDISAPFPASWRSVLASE